ncbi:hypothetical protein MROS_1802 [Melioribacter roseus P3M-2]|uniref:DUF5683 domain-containing protein n=1 Tax=Melioribacter roseus (strain DSM 23840 / JCM 17771 / VKM B-2668 / P3M-2) TaxID=1191523 RepID=I7A582_MELRP|nr:hypothetical protein [Melioribacter roseus]AFN75036.1 hypothetical protein MROS_1802 [Melioribacter roseus P3M-2]
MKRIFLLLMFSSMITAQTSGSLLEIKYAGSNRQLVTERYNPVTMNVAQSKKNAGLAILYSMILPGMGELYAGDYGSGIYFTAADAALWGVYAGYSIYGKWKEDDYKAFAVSNGGISTDGKDDSYYASIGIYMNIEEYNRIQELNRSFAYVYDTDTHYWRWNNNEDRRKYRELWKSSEQAYNNLRFAVGALILNRIISAINAVRLVAIHNRNLNESLGCNISFEVVNNADLPSTFKLNFVKSF